MSGTIAAVFKNTVDNSSPIALFVDSNITPEDLKQQWETKTGISPRDFFFVIANGPRILPSSGSLASVLPEDAFHVALSVQPSVEIFVAVRRMPSINWNFPLRPDTTAEDILSDARKHLSISEDRELKLLMNNQSIAFDATIKDLPECSWPITVEVDVTLTVSVTSQLFNEDKGANERIERKAFLSSPASSLPLGDGQWRLLTADRQKAISGSEEIGELVNESDLTAGCVTFVAERALTLYLTTRKDKTVQEMHLWPTDKLGSICTRPSQALRYNGKNFKDLDATLLDLGVSDQSFAEVVELIRLTIHDDGNCSREVEVDQDMTFANLELPMSNRLFSPRYFVRVGDTTILSSTASLRALGIGDNSEIKVRYESTMTKLLYGSRDAVTVDLGSVRDFQDLLRVTSAALDLELPADTRFQCLCGRSISREQPRACCLDLVLRVIAHERKAIDTSEAIQELTCLLPPRSPLEVFTAIKALSGAHSDKRRREAEIQVCLAVLRLLDAKDVRLTVPDHFEVSVQLSNGRRLEMEVRPDSQASALLEGLVERGFEAEGAAFVINGVRQNAEQLQVPFCDLGLRRGQVLVIEGAVGEAAIQGEGS